MRSIIGLLLIIISFGVSADFNYQPEFEKKEVLVILKEFNTMEELKAYYKTYRSKWINKNPTKTPPPENVLAWSRWDVMQDDDGDLDYCVIWMVRTDQKSIEERSYQLGHEALHCFKGGFHNN
jgi:hypothetical protein